MTVATTLAIEVAFPRGVYSGSAFGAQEELPDHARLHEAFVAAAAGGPAATPGGRVLVARADHRRAVEWLEQTDPVGVVVPPLDLHPRDARRYRWRASPVAAADTPFEPQVALGGPVTYLWPRAPDDVLAALEELGREVTHLGRADSVVAVRVFAADSRPVAGLHRVASRRGPGRVMRIPRAGRFRSLVDAHAQASRPGRHGTGPIGKQAPDLLVTGANDEALALRRFEPVGLGVEWPFAELWEMGVSRVGTSEEPDDEIALRREMARPQNRVAVAVGVHRALVHAIGDDVPAFVRGRDGDAPLRGAGHLAIHVRPQSAGDALGVLLALPRDTPAVDREQLARAVERPLRAGARLASGRPVRYVVRNPVPRPAVPFWPVDDPVMRTEVPFVVDVNGGPRGGGWTLDDATVCSVGFALRGVLERQGMEWGEGWRFRERLVDTLRRVHGVRARAVRVRRNAARFAHRVRPGDLIVAAHAAVDLGELAPERGGFIAIGRARHLGGGLLVPGGTSA